MTSIGSKAQLRIGREKSLIITSKSGSIEKSIIPAQLANVFFRPLFFNIVRFSVETISHVLFDIQRPLLDLPVTVNYKNMISFSSQT